MREKEVEPSERRERREPWRKSENPSPPSGKSCCSGDKRPPSPSEALPIMKPRAVRVLKGPSFCQSPNEMFFVCSFPNRGDVSVSQCVCVCVCVCVCSLLVKGSTAQAWGLVWGGLKESVCVRRGVLCEGEGCLCE